MASFARQQTSDEAREPKDLPAVSNTNCSLLVQGLVTKHLRAYSCSQCSQEVLFLHVVCIICIIKSVRDRVLYLISVSPPIQQARLMLALASFDRP